MTSYMPVYLLICNRWNWCWRSKEALCLIFINKRLNFFFYLSEVLPPGLDLTYFLRCFPRPTSLKVHMENLVDVASPTALYINR